jgi:hypothetical protein
MLIFFCAMQILMPDIQSGVQHKAVVEYAPSQRVPKPSTKKDGREGTIYKGINVVVIFVPSRYKIVLMLIV